MFKLLKRNKTKTIENNIFIQKQKLLRNNFYKESSSLSKTELKYKKISYEKDMNLLENRKVYYGEKLLKENNFIKYIFSFVIYKIIFLTIKNWFLLKHLNFINYISKQKRFTNSMIDEVWWKNILFIIFRIFFLTFMVVVVLFPFYWMISVAFRTPEEIREGETGFLSIWPKEWSWGAFKFLFNNPALKKGTNISITRAIMVSCFVCILSIISQITISLLCGFGLSYVKTRFNEIFIILLLATIMIPSEALLLGQYLLISKINLRDTFPALFVPFIGNAFTIFMFVNAFKQIDDSIIKSAKIDGLSSWKFFWKIAIPSIKSTIITAILISLISTWNSILWPQMIIQQEKKYFTIPMILWNIINSTGDPNSIWNYGDNLDPQNLKMAASIISILPMFLIFIFTKKYLVVGIESKKALKG